MAKDRLSSSLAVILHADVAGSTALVQEDKELAHERIQDSFRRFSQTIETYFGQVLEFRGDALLARFNHASDAVLAALSFQADQKNYIEHLKDNVKPYIRVGISMGEVIVADNTVTGAGVVQAQRIEALADPGRVYITAAIHEALSKRLPYDLVNIGEQALKGFEHPVHVYRIDLRSGASIPSPLSKDSNIRPPVDWKKNGFSLVMLALIVTILVYWLGFTESDSRIEVTKQTDTSLIDSPTIAVLPFTNISSDAEQEYFADGMTEDLITDISKISGLKVIARHSTFSYKGQNPDVRNVGEELGATHVIEGSVRKSGSTVRITIQLTDASDGKHVWAERYDRELRDVFAIQDEVIGEIITAMSLRLTPEEERRITKHETENLAAFDLFMRGRQQESIFTKESFVEAQQHYEQAVALDPNYAEAWARLAQIHALNGQFGWVEDILTADQHALSLVEKSLKLDPDSPFIRYSYSRILSRDSIGQHERAIEEAQKAIDLDPNFADAHAWLGQLYILTGQAKKTIPHISTAMGINPNFPFWYNYTYGYAHYFKGEFDKAAENIELAVDRNPNVYFTRLAYAASLAMAGRQDEAEWQIDELYSMGFNKTRDELIQEHPIQDPTYRNLYDEGLKKAGLP